LGADGTVGFKGWINLNTKFDLEQPQKLSMEKYFPLTTNTSYTLIGLLSHCGEDTSVGHNLAYRLIDRKWYYFNDDEVQEINECEIGKAYGLSEGGCETAYLAFFEQLQKG
jgi:ubiquitin C-terminal hydrolase